MIRQVAAECLILNRYVIIVHLRDGEIIISDSDKVKFKRLFIIQQEEEEI